MENQTSETQMQAGVDLGGKSVAVIIPCYNEELSIAQVVRDFRQALPGARIFVYDNDSTDRSRELAEGAGAAVIRESRRGKGFVVRSMFMEVDAEIYLMVDGDATYSAADAAALIQPVLQRDVDMTVGNRLSLPENHGCFRPLHLFGNRLVARSVNFSFGSQLEDIMSGYRCMSRRLVKTLPLVSRGFEIETQMTVQALYYGFKIRELPVRYRDRVEGSSSKLQTFRDGAKVLLTIINALKAYRPLAFFSATALLPFMFGIFFLSVSLRTTAFFWLLAGMTLLSGLILDVLNHRLRELSQTIALSIAAANPAEPPSPNQRRAGFG